VIVLSRTIKPVKEMGLRLVELQVHWQMEFLLVTNGVQLHLAERAKHVQMGNVENKVVMLMVAIQVEVVEAEEVLLWGARILTILEVILVGMVREHGMVLVEVMDQ